MNPLNLRARQVIRLPDGREGTVVYSGLDGIGIKWGRHEIPAGELEKYTPVFWRSSQPVPGEDWDWEPDAMLRDPYSSATLPCVGEEFEVVAEP